MSQTLATVRCPSCQHRLAKATDEMRRLNAENELLRNEVSELQDLLEGIDVDIYVTTQYGTCFHRRYCKWVREIPDSYLTEFLTHEDAVAVRKPCKTCRA